MAQAAADIEVVTEELPPYNMTENGQVTGLSTEIVQAVMKQAGVSAPIQVMPWARAYDRASEIPNVLIYSIARTPQREPLFQWVGAIAPTRWFLYSLADKPIHLNSLADAHGHQIATVNKDAGQEYLLSQGFVMGRELQSTTKYENNYHMLKVDHVELWISNELNAYYLTRRNGADPDQELVRSLELKDLGGAEGLNMAFSKGTPPERVEQFRQALATVRKNGTYDAILKRWLSGEGPTPK
ncbi:transporter substrate-binding domain-containing protein [Pseudomonas sp. NPDC007930]|uniref:substrate-binding periplasmic protein n=1 Tax=Pseudomonas sp. NPDC007930 TaxID=3364417 RepID=UPI0036E12C22